MRDTSMHHRGGGRLRLVRDVAAVPTASGALVAVRSSGRHHHTWRELSVEHDEFGVVRQCACTCGLMRYDDRAVVDERAAA